jgi:uncharacterized protein YnzC (UPF0291/DUF896 family)
MQQETKLDQGISKTKPGLLHTFNGFTSSQSDSIKLFMDTYSAIHVAWFTPEEKARLRERLLYNKVLVKLLDNLDVPKTYTVDYIEEPIYLKIYQFNNKTIYIFGEHHRPTFGHCASSIVHSPDPDTPSEHVPAAYIPPRDETGTIIGGMANQPPPGELSHPFIPPDTLTLRFDEWINQLRQLTPSFFDLYIETSLEELERPATEPLFRLNDGFLQIYLGVKRLIENIKYLSSMNYDNPHLYIYDIELPKLGKIYTDISRRIVDERINNPHIQSPIPPDYYHIDQQDNNIINTINSIIKTDKNMTLTSNNIQHIRKDAEMYNFRNKFRNCFIPSTRKTQANFEACMLARFHNVDARNIDIGEAKITPLQMGMEIYLLFSSDDENLEEQEVVDIFTELNTLDFLRTLMIPRLHLPPNTPLVWTPNTPLDLPPLPDIITVLYDDSGDIIPQPLPPIPDPPVQVDMYAQNMFDYILSTFPKAEKEYSRSYYKDKIRQRIVNKLLTTTVSPINFNKLIHKAIFVLHQPLVNFQKTLRILMKLSEYFFYAMALVMDTYCLSRVFKKFDVETDFQPKETHNIIIYAGDLHSDMYSEFIENELGHAPVYNERTVSSPDYSCVRINLSGLNI